MHERSLSPRHDLCTLVVCHAFAPHMFHHRQLKPPFGDRNRFRMSPSDGAFVRTCEMSTPSLS